MKKISSNTRGHNPWSGQYATHAHSHITRAVAAMYSYFGLVRPQQHGMSLKQKQDIKSILVCPTLQTCNTLPPVNFFQITTLLGYRKALTVHFLRLNTLRKGMTNTHILFILEAPTRRCGRDMVHIVF